MTTPLTCPMADPPHIGGRVCKHTQVLASGGVCAMQREIDEMWDERGREWHES